MVNCQWSMVNGIAELGEGVHVHVCGAEVAVGGEAVGDGDAGDAGVASGGDAVFGVFDDEAGVGGQGEKVLRGEEEGGVRFDGVAVCAAEDAGEEVGNAEFFEPAAYPVA